MTARLFSLASLSVLPWFMLACSKCGEDVYLTGPDLPPDQAAAVYAAQGGDIPFEDIKVGAGGIAQPGRMFSFQVDAHDEQGKTLGSGTLTFFQPAILHGTMGIRSGFRRSHPRILWRNQRNAGRRNPTLLPAATRPPSYLRRHRPGRHRGTCSGSPIPR